MDTSMDQKTGTAALAAIGAAIGGIVLAVSGHPGWGLLAHLFAGASGMIGLLRSASPRVSGGLLSIGAMVLAMFGLGLDVLVWIGKLVL